MIRRRGFGGSFAIVVTMTLAVLLLPLPPGLTDPGKRALRAGGFNNCVKNGFNPYFIILRVIPVYR